MPLSKTARAVGLAVMLLVPTGCALVRSEPPPAVEVSAFRVYNLHEICSRPLEPDELKTFLAMVRDAVGGEEWYSNESTIHVLDGVLTVRTSAAGHERIAAFFSRFRAINEARR